jgi:hypothetical protein
MGRPRKYTTKEEAANAKAMKQQLRRAQQLDKSQPEPSKRYIPYAPTPSDVPLATPANLGIRSNLFDSGPQELPQQPSQQAPLLEFQQPYLGPEEDQDQQSASSQGGVGDYEESIRSYLSQANSKKQPSREPLSQTSC